MFEQLTRRGLIAAAAVALSGFAAAQQAPIVIKFSHVSTTMSPKHLAAEYFKKLAEENTHGRVKVEVYSNSTLYKDKEELEALQLGAVQMVSPAPGKFSSMGLRDFEVFDLPYLFDNDDQVHLVTEGPIGKRLLAQLEPKGLKGLAFWDNGFKQMSANRPLKTPEDFKGLKMRIFGSKVLDAEMRSLSAIPQVLAANDIYTSMQTGLVDGGENPVTTFNEFRLYEVQKYLTLSNHGYVGYVVVTNKKFWDGLPPDIRAILDDAVAKSALYENALAKKQGEDVLAALRKIDRLQVLTLTPAEHDAWKKAMFTSHAAVADRISKDLLQSIYKTTGNTVAP
ncbi:MAG TPA: DctP family TRAP transporter solute-binding subunit [Burkholderiaceae bacterium]|jgi:C4-dicarboxylate-binding protein DctP